MSYAGLGLTSPGLNPLNQRPLLPWQRLVMGPASTGPRVTVVDLTAPEGWMPWITRDSAGNPTDTGTTPGGTWDGSGSQHLPDLVVTGQPWWVWALVVALGYLLFFGKDRDRPRY